MFEMVKNALSRLERSRTKKKQFENPPEKTPFQAWSDEYRALASRVDNALRSKPKESSPELQKWHAENLGPLMKDLVDFKDRWGKYVGGKFSSKAVIDIDALLQRARISGGTESEKSGDL
ncbi:hypothetical protein HY417_01775 [Candidatus Kaiserbacteria bacterium]|nr:hypothetical protein [Candidatus Kaiserbacteria bacterium]